MPLAYDLFCGAGGSTIGLQRAGFRVVGFDNARDASRTQRANRLRCVRADLDDETWTWDGYEQPLLVWASPPCQPWSISGRFQGKQDDRDQLPAFFYALERLRPTVAIFENVKGLTFAKHERYLEALLANMEDIGYECEWRILNCADFGVAQTRERLILVARSDGEPVGWPESTTTQWVTCAAALSHRDNLPAWTAERPSTTVVATFSAEVISAPGWRPKDAPRQSGDTFKVEPWEAAMLQGFPDGWQFQGNKKSIYRQIGNAVPPALAEAVVRAQSIA